MFMTDAQKKVIYDLIKKSFTISTKSVTASCVYENQIIPSGRDSAPLESNATYPMITLKYHDTEDTILDQGVVVMKMARLNVNVYAASIDDRGSSGTYLNGKQAVDEMTRQVLDHLNDNYETAFPSGIYLTDRIPGVKVMDLSTIATRKHVYRNKFTLNITYEV